MPKIFARDRDGNEHQVEAQPGLSVMLILRDDGGMDIASICGGTCSCGTCHVYVEPEWLERLPQQAPDEVEVLEASFNLKDNSRLSCQIEFTSELDGLKVTLAPED